MKQPGIHTTRSGSVSGAAKLPRTLVDVLRARAAADPDRRAYTFLGDDEDTLHLSWGELDERARKIAAFLQDTLPAGERAILLYPPGLDFLAAFLGCLYAGTVAVPAYPPGSRRQLPRLETIVRDARPAVALTTADRLKRFVSLCRRAPSLAGLHWQATDALDAGLAAAWRQPALDGSRLAFLQYTSGSTSAPKGVQVTHGNLVHNEERIRRAFAQSEHSVVVGWLPVYHDMGLIGNVLQPLYVGARCVLMAPLAFLQRPRRWLEAITRYRATTSGGPNFAYDLCVRKIRPADREGLDLSSWRVAFNGAEPVRAGTLERFARAFAPQGFERRAFLPCYGLAEATLLVSGAHPAEAPRTLRVDAGELEKGRVAVAPLDAPEAGRELVGCGASEDRVVVVDPESGAPCEEGHVGEIWVGGESVADGYWERPDDNRELFDARLAGGEGPFLRTGDLGFLGGDELFVTGRLKDLIILRGRNLYPQDLEWTAGAAHPALRPDGGAAFSVEVEGEERPVLVQEIERRREDEAEAAALAIRRAVAEAHEARLHEVVVARAGSVPKTSSGKVQRRACRRAWSEGKLHVLAVSARETGDGAGEPAEMPVAEALDRESLLELPAEDRHAALSRWLSAEVARAVDVDPGRVVPGTSLIGLGLDSLAAVELQHRVEEGWEVSLPLGSLMSDGDLDALTAEVLDRLETVGEATPLVAEGPRAGDHPASAGQKALWFLQRLAPESAAYNLVAAARVRGPFDAQAFAEALEALAERHPALRTTFPEVEGEPRQRVAESPWIERVDLDVEGLGDGEIARRLADEVWRPFDLEQGPLLRWVTLPGGPGGHAGLLALAIHHTVSDFWSMARMVRELGELYAERTGGPAARRGGPVLRFSDWVRWQDERLAGERGEALWRAWQERLAGMPRVLELPTDRPRPPRQSFRGSQVRIFLEAGPRAGLEAMAVARGTTLLVVLLAAFETLLHRFSGQSRFLVGTPTAGRQPAGVDDVLGYFVNLLPLPADFSSGGSRTVSEHVDEVRRRALDAFADGDYPFPLLASRLEGDRDPARPPLFQTAFVLQQAQRAEDEALAGFTFGWPGAEISLGESVLECLPLETRFTPFELTLMAAELDGGLAFALQFSIDLFDVTTARRLLGQWRTLLSGLALSPDRPLAEVPWLGRAERAQLLREWSDTRRPLPEHGSLKDLFDGWVERAPHALALATAEGDLHLSYGELARRASRLARRLRRRGVGTDVPVAAFVERSAEAVVAILAILEAGGAYVPLDPAYPAERLRFLLDDCGAPLLLTTVRWRPSLPESLPGHVREILLVDEPGTVSEEEGPGEPALRPRPSNLAYVLYTSGSTGRPKGVGVTHRGVVHMLRSSRRIRYGRDECLPLAANLAFDATNFELWGALLHGARLVIFPPRASSLGEWSERIERHRVTTLFLTASLYHQMAEDAVERGAGRLASVRQFLTGAEAVRAGPTRELLAAAPGLAVVNCFGPTECTTYVCCERAGHPRDVTQPFPIGRPIADTRIRLLGRAGRPVPIGVAGELCAGGPGLARAYLGRPGLTAERFVPDATSERVGERLYRTGDLARYRADGRLEFLGRSDHQVKLRGVRIELGEVETALQAEPGVGSAVARVLDPPTAGGAGGQRLVAWVTPATADPEALRSALAARLPPAMVPAAIVPLDGLPLTAHGKVDTARLPAPSWDGAVSRESAAGPTEELLAGIFAEVLGLEDVGVDQDFFELGGHSLLATRAVSRIRRVLGVELPLQDLFEHPIVAALAARIDAGRRRGEAVIERLPRDPEAGLPLSFAQQRLWFLDQLEPGGVLYNVAGALELEGELDVAALAASFAGITRRHEALRTTFRDSRGRPVQVIHDDLPGGGPRLPVHDLEALPPRAREAELERLARRAASRPFDLVRGPLLRTVLVRLAARRHVLILTMHHIVSDGWSLGLMVREVRELYGAGRAGEAAGLTALPVQYADFAAWQRHWLAGEVLERQLGWWQERLAGAPPLELPSDRPRPAVLSHRGATLDFRLDDDLRRDLAALGRRHGVTLFMTLLAAFDVVLHRLSGRADLSVGTPVANRNRADVEDLIGFFVNTLVMRVDLDAGDGAGELTFAGLLERVRDASLGAYAHQDLPFELLVERLEVERELDRTPLFQVMLILQNAPLDALELADLELGWHLVTNGTSKFDLTVSLTEDEAGLAGSVEYSTDLFDETTVRRLARRYATLLEDAARRPGARLGELADLGPGERHQLLAEWNDTGLRQPGGEPAILARERPVLIQDLFEAQAARTPEAVAVVSEVSGTFRDRLTFGELDARAERLAGELAALGVAPEVRVGICLERSPAQLIAFLAILKAGGAYVALDPTYPAERLGFMLRDAQVPLLLTQRSLRERESLRDDLWGSLGESTRLVLIDARGRPEEDLGPGVPAPARRRARPHNLMYVIYTSGSTGKPKGISMTHEVALNTVGCHLDLQRPGARTLQFAPLSFDICYYEMFSAWGTAGLIFQITETTIRDVVAMARLMNEGGIEKAILPVVLVQLLAEEFLSRDPRRVPLRELTSTGEKLLVTPGLRDFFARYGEARLLNMYGPSEAHVVTHGFLARSPDAWPANPSIGRTAARTHIYLVGPRRGGSRLDGQPGDLVAPGGIGEVLISGVCLARGYLARPAVTAASFVPDPFSEAPGERLYKTGDLARHLPDGNFEFIGRRDHQVKVRGYRIELGEVEAALGDHPRVAGCSVVVLAGGTRDARLVAFVVPEPGDEGPPSLVELADFLGARLPGYMVPSAFVLRDALPLNAAGKIDRDALGREARKLELSVDEAHVAPRTAVEEILAGIWSEVLDPDKDGDSSGGAGRFEPISVQADFFRLGGHSLLATQVIARIRSTFGVELPVRSLFEAPTIAALGKRIEKARRAAARTGERPAPPLVAAPREPGPDGVVEMPLSFAQQRLWFLDQLESGSPLYNLPAAVRFEGELDARILERCLAEIVRRHESLRTTFASRDGKPVQRIAPASPVALPVVDLGRLAAPDAESGRLSRREAVRPFDLERGPLLRAALLRLGAGEHVLLLNQHHIVSDGWSLGVLSSELRGTYSDFQRGGSGRPDLPPLQYADFAVWQRHFLEAGALETQLAHWRERLAGVEPLELPGDRPRPTRRGARGATLHLVLPADLVAGLHGLGQRHGATLFMVLLAAFQVFLRRLTGRHDFCVGTPVANRNRAETEDLLGFFVNTLALRAELAGDPRGDEVLGTVRDTTLDAYAHQDVPFERLVDELGLERDLHRTPLVQVFFALQNAPLELALPGLVLQPMELDTGTAKFDFNLSFTERDGELLGAAEVDADLYDSTTVRRWLGHYEAILRELVGDAARPISHLPLLSPAQTQQVVREWNAYRTLGPGARALMAGETSEPTLHGLFDLQVAGRPDAVALVSPDGHVSFAELDRRARSVAGRLQELGAGLETTVALVTEDPGAIATGIFGILKAGAVCLPLDGQNPPGRLEYMLEDSGAAVLVTEGSAGEGLEGTVPVLRLEDVNPEYAAAWRAPAIRTGNLAYMIYTSGTTGRPKGVATHHGSLLPLTRWSADYFRLGPGTAALQSLSVAFDFGFFEVLATIACGGTLHFRAAERRVDFEHYVDVVQERRIDTVQATPSFFREAVALGRPMPSLEVLHLGGEVLPRDLVERIAAVAPRCAVHNGYGPTECGVNSFQYRAGESAVPAAALGGGMPLGKGSGQTAGYVLDRRGVPVPPGALGELAIGGLSPARGYHRRPAATAEKFVPDPFGPRVGARLYRTGDLVRHLADGTLEFHGRLDHQVKIRGFRIELGEIEAALVSQPDVETAVVLVLEEPPGTPRLAAWVVAPAAELSLDERRRRLERDLPPYMVPAAILEIDELPRTPNGKLDRRALPAPVWEGEASAALVAPSTPVEEILAGIWADVLGRSEVAANESFFDLGGHSLLATQVVSRVRRALGVEVPVRALFEHPTVAALAGHLEALRQGGAGESDGADLSGALERGGWDTSRAPLSFAQERMWVLDQMEPGNPAYNISGPVRLRGRLERGALEAAIAAVIRRHAVVRTAFRQEGDGPVQVILTPEDALAGGGEARLPEIDLRRLADGHRRRLSEQLARAQSRRPFHLDRAPLLRFSLARLDEEEHVLVVSLHHIVGDGWSLGILIREVGLLYDAFRQGRPSPLPELDLQYADFAAWQRERFAGGALDAQVGYWKKCLAPPVTILDLPADRPRPPVRTFRGRRVVRGVPGGLAEDVRALSRQEGVSLFMTLLAAFEVVLHRLAGQDDVVVGTPIAGRTRAETEGLIGFFLNTLVLRTDLSGRPSFRELLARVRDVSLEAYAHQDLPFERLLEELNPERDLSRTPLFQVFFNMLNVPQEPLELPGLTLEPLELPDALANFDMTLYVHDEEELSFELVYNADLFDRRRIEEMLGQLEGVLEQVTAGADRAIAGLDLLTAEAGCHLPELGAPLDMSWRGAVHELLAARARQRPDKVALVEGESCWTYHRLDADVRELALGLRRRGLAPGALTVIFGHRGAPLVRGVLAVLAAGGAFVIVDPDYPAARLIDIVDAVGPRLWLAIRAAGDPPDELSQRLRTLPGCVLLELGPDGLAGQAPPADEPFAPVRVGPDHPACIVFTSGSTARPKGIVGRHGSLTHFTPWQVRDLGLRASDRFCLFSGLAHDPLQREIFTPFQVGASLAIPDADDFDNPGRLAAWLASRRVTQAHLTPAMGRVLTDSLSQHADITVPSLRRAFFVGDVLTRRNLEKILALAPNLRPANTFGSTETQRAVAVYPVPLRPGRSGLELDERTAGFEVLPLGRGAEDVQLLLLNPAGRLAGVGEVGEICVRSPHTALGYLDDPALTAERFAPHPFAGAPGERIYRTGDLGRYLPDGHVVFAGRGDQQVKIRGFRIELGEIESWLGRHPAIEEAVAMTWGTSDAEKRLVAYVVPAGGRTPSSRELRDYLGEHLPAFMVPASFVTLEALPLTPNRKIDRRALPAPEPVEAAAEYVAPRGPVEEAVAGIWAAVLGRERVGIRDNFFDLGGHSLLATQVISRVYDTFQVEVRLQTFFTDPTVEGLAAAVSELQFSDMDATEQDLLERIESLSDEEIERELALLRGSSGDPE